VTISRIAGYVVVCKNSLYRPLGLPRRPAAARARLAARGADGFRVVPYDMLRPLAGERIRRDHPGVKLLVMLREPVAWALETRT
jgi:hypothetical protein